MDRLVSSAKCRYRMLVVMSLWRRTCWIVSKSQPFLTIKDACEKWLKDRRGRQLSYDDLTHYQRVIAALKETFRLMEEIDKAVPEWPIKWEGGRESRHGAGMKIPSTFAKTYIDNCRIYQFGLYEGHVTEKRICGQWKRLLRTSDSFYMRMVRINAASSQGRVTGWNIRWFMRDEALSQLCKPS